MSTHIRNKFKPGDKLTFRSDVSLYEARHGDIDGFENSITYEMARTYDDYPGTLTVDYSSDSGVYFIEINFGWPSFLFEYAPPYLALDEVFS